MERYLAFISYRHNQFDQNIAFQLRRHLEGFHLPTDCPLPKKRRVFRDTDELPTSTDLGADIENALQDSQFLIALCSKDYVQSKWCLREIERFVEMGKKDCILPVLIAGDEEISIPDQIRDLPVVLDLRGRSSRQIRESVSILLERMSGTSAQEISASERKHRVTVRAGILAAAAAVLLGLILYALQTSRSIQENNQTIREATQEAIEAEKEAIEKRDQAFLGEADYLADKAWAAINRGNDKEAVQLALSALPDDMDSDLPVSVHAVNALRMALSIPDRQRSTYQFLGSVELDVPVSGYFFYRDSNVVNELSENVYHVAIETDPLDKYLHLLSFEDGEMYTDNNYGAEGALEEGYTKVITYSSTSTSKAKYGGGKQLEFNYLPGIHDSTLNGRPFMAEYVYNDGINVYSIASDGDHTALFGPESPEAIAELDVEVPLKSMSFSQWLADVLKKDALNYSQQVAVVDNRGLLKVFRDDDGSELVTFEGKWRFATYFGDRYYLYAVDEQGNGSLINVLTMETKTTLKAPSPIRTLSYCADKDILLALCEDCVAVINGWDGELLTQVPLEDRPLYADWTEGPWSSGNQFVTIYEDHIDRYMIETKEEDSSACCIVLTHPGQHQGFSDALYSDDGKYVYLQDRSGDISMWDAQTGTLCWINESGWERTPLFDGFCFNLDHTAIWRSQDNEEGYEKIDAATGKTIFSTQWDYDKARGNIRQRKEDTSGSYALSLSGPDYDMIFFDAENGRKIWAGKYMGDAVFSKDGEEILCLEEADGELICRHLDVWTGIVRSEETLVLPEECESLYFVMDEETCTALVGNKWLVDLQTGDIEEAEPDPEEHCIFAGQDAHIVESEDEIQLISDNDGSLILDTGGKNLAVSPDGDSLVMYGNGYSAYLVLASDVESMVREAENMLTQE